MRLLFRRAAVAMSAMLCTPVMALTATVTEGGDLHSQAHFMSPRIATVHRLSTVEVLEQRRDWVRIEIDGNRSGWIPEHKLSIATAPPAGSAATGAATGAAATGPGAIPGASRMIPRSSPRASNHALILTLGDAAAADAESATAIARLMGVPDANIRQPAAAQLDADGLRQALAGLDARLGNDDRAFIYLAGDGTRPRRDAPCGDAILSADREAFGLTEFAGYVRSLARKVDKLVVIVDAGRGNGTARGFSGRYTPDTVACSGDALPTAARNVLTLTASHSGQNAFADDKGGIATQALRTCLDDQPASGLVTGDDWRHCAQTRIDARLAGSGARQTLTLGGNPALIPAPTLAGSGPTDPRKLLQTIHEQRSERRSVSLAGLRTGYRADDTLRITVSGPATRAPHHAYLYLLAAGDSGFTLLHPGPSAPAERFDGNRTVNVPLRELAGGGRQRLLAIVADSPRNFLRAGFSGAGNVATAPADARTLRDLPLEILGGDTSLVCQRSETRNLGPTQARQCSTAFGAAIADIVIAP